MTPIIMTTIFYPSPVLPKTDNIYWCIIKSIDIVSKVVTYHYSFVSFNDGKFMDLEMEGLILEVAAWSEPEDPERHFRPKPRIISH